jgi:dihydrodipicolinate synthase/N-acetylneuraminate lyase
MKRVIVAIPASYDQDEALEVQSTIEYLKYLQKAKVETVMTTAGTSHFNLLSLEEIHLLNKTVVENFEGQKIIGIPALSTTQAVEFVSVANSYIDENTNLMALYPERFYDESEIINYMSNIRSKTNNKIYIHGKTIRNATGGVWDYNSSVLNQLYDCGVLLGIKEEHSNLYKSYDFISNLKPALDVIVAGGSMRRFEFLESAGANSFLSGIGNLFPHIEKKYLNGSKIKPLELEKKFFDVFMKYGWHKSLRIGLDLMGITCYNDRSPWPKRESVEYDEIKKIIEVLKNEE